MARTTATNFTAGLQFPYATAATDLFKKEDVQTLALALDQHDHTTGKGLGIGATSIADGSITTAKIAAGAITQITSAKGVTLNPGTTSGTYVDVTDMTVTMTTTGGRLLAVLASRIQMTGAGGNIASIAFSLDGAAEVGPSAQTYTVNYSLYHETAWDFGVVSAASHTVKGRFFVSGAGSTITAVGDNRILIVMEFKK